jgi:hypothetical protein
MVQARGRARVTRRGEESEMGWDGNSQKILKVMKGTGKR